MLKQNGAQLELPLDINMFGKTEFQLQMAALGRTLRPSVEAKYVDQCCAPGFEGGGVDEIQCLMSFSPECWKPLGPARPPTGQQLPAYCKPVGRGGHKQAKQFKPGQSRGRFAKFTHALQKLH